MAKFDQALGEHGLLVGWHVVVIQIKHVPIQVVRREGCGSYQRKRAVQKSFDSDWHGARQTVSEMKPHPAPEWLKTVL
jgi:hypothetical protein